MGAATARRRRHRRLTVRVIVDITSARGLRRETASTLGAGGLFVSTDRPLAKGTRLKLRFQLPERDTVHEIEGRVAWASAPGRGIHGVPHGTGMCIAFQDRRATKRLAEDLEAFSDAFDAPDLPDLPDDDAPRADD